LDRKVGEKERKIRAGKTKSRKRQVNPELSNPKKFWEQGSRVTTTKKPGERHKKHHETVFYKAKLQTPKRYRKQPKKNSFGNDETKKTR